MSRFLLTFAFACALVVSAGSFNTGAKAEDKKDAKAEKAKPDTPETKAGEGLAAAHTMAELGRASKSPLLLLAAAKVIGTTPTSKFDLKDAKTASKISETDLLTEAVALLDEAKKLAGSDESFAKQVAAVEKEIRAFTGRGRVGGAKSVEGVVDATYDKTDDFYCAFTGGQVAKIWVTNLTGKGDIDVSIYDLDGRFITADNRKDGSAFVQWTPKTTSKYKIVVKAYAGNVALKYRISTN